MHNAPRSSMCVRKRTRAASAVNEPLESKSAHMVSKNSMRVACASYEAVQQREPLIFSLGSFTYYSACLIKFVHKNKNICS